MSNTTPWKCGHAFQNNGPDYWLIATQLFRGQEIAKATTQANAEFIVRACNAHYDLLAACEALIEFWDNGTPVRPGAEVVNDLRAALAKAKNQTEPAQNS